MAVSSAFLTIYLLLLLLLLTTPKIQSYSPLINIWPKPTSISWPTTAFSNLSPSFQIQSPSHPPLRRAVSFYTRILYTEDHTPLNPAPNLSVSSTLLLRFLDISVSNLSAPLDVTTDESYSISIPLSSNTATIRSNTAWGAIRGLETFSQLASGADPTVLPVGIEIEDRPLFPHRGVLLDTARNFYAVKDIFRTLRAMAHNKLNVFHWHLTDSQSFPLVLPSVPLLAQAGAYSRTMRYTPRDVRRVVRFAESLGIRVIPEVDTPGHSASWAAAYPEIVTCAGNFWAPRGGPALAAEPGTGQLNPLKPETYRIVREMLRDLSVAFPDNFLHAGADEVNTACWEDDTDIRHFLAAGGTHDQLLEMFVNKTRPYIVDTLKRTVVYWEDLLLDAKVKVGSAALPTETTVLQTWNKGPANTKRIVSAGYRAIVSSSDFYYLDCGHGGWVGNDSRYDKQDGDEPGKPFNEHGGTGGSWCAPFKTWQRVYDYDIVHGLTDEEAKRVLGGEVALWSEQADGAVLDGRLWPRAAAAGETLWSGNRDKNGKKRYAEATDRLNEWRYRMVGRGIQAEPIQPLWCALHPSMCNLGAAGDG